MNLRQTDWSQLPYPVALTGQRLSAALDGEEDTLRTLFKLRDCFEATIKYAGCILTQGYLGGDQRSLELDAQLLDQLIRPSLGLWVDGVVHGLARLQADDDRPLIGPVAQLFMTPREEGKPRQTDLMEQCRAFVTFRNDVLGHGVCRGDADYRRALEQWLPSVEGLLEAVAQAWGNTRLLLVQDLDQAGLWMGPQPADATVPGDFSRDQIGHYVLREQAEADRAAPHTLDLYPLICYLPDERGERRFHFYDQLARYRPTRKSITVLEYDLGFKHATDEPVEAFERSFNRELLLRAFEGHRRKMARIESRIAHFGELIEAHAEIVGRRFAIERVQRFLEEHDRGLLVIEAEPGKGKTALMAHLVDHVFADTGPPPVHFFYRRTEGTIDPDTCIGSLYHALLNAHNLEVAAESAEQDSPEAQYIKLVNLLNHEVAPRLEPDRRQLIFIDALDEAQPRTDQPSAFQRIPENLPKGVYIIATTRPVAERTDLARRSHLHWYNLDDPDLLQEHLGDANEYVQRELLGLAPPPAGETLDQIARLSAGNFLVLKLLCEHVRTVLAPDEVPDFLRRLATSGSHDKLGFIYEGFWQRMVEGLSRDDANLLGEVAGLLGYTAAPLTAEIICHALGLRLGDWDFARRRLIQYLTVIEQEEDQATETFYRLYHESFADFIRARLAPDATAIHRRFADYCLGWADLPEGYGRDYALRFGPHHLTEARRWDDLEALLTDLWFLEAKNEAGWVFDLARDFEHAAERTPAERPRQRIIRLLGEALRREIHFIHHHRHDYPQALFQSLWDNVWWYDTPEAQPYYEEPEGGWNASNAPWRREGEKLHKLLERWRAQRKDRHGAFVWMRSLRPPAVMLGAPLLAVLRGHHLGVDSVAFSPDGRRIISASMDGIGRVWDADQGQQLAVLRGAVECVAFSPDGQRIVSGAYGNTVRVWDADNGRELAVLKGHEQWVTNVAFSPDGRRIVSGSRDGTVRLWDADNGGELAVLSGHDEEVTSVACSPDGRRIASGSRDGTVRLWDVATRQELVVLRGHDCRVESVNSVAFLADNRCIVSGSCDKTVCVWDADNGKILAVLRGKTVVTRVVFSPDGQRIASALRDDTVRVWDVANGRELAVFRGHESLVQSVAWSPDGRRIVSGSWDRTIHVWDADRGRGPAVLRGHDDWLLSVAFSPDGRRIVSGKSDGTVRLWDADNGRELAAFEGHEDAVVSVAFSPDGGRIVSGSWDYSIRAWDAATGATLAVLRGKDRVESVAFSPDGRRIVSGSRDGTVRLWEADEGRELAVLRGHTNMLTSVAFSPDGRRIVSRSFDGTVRVWDLTTQQTASLQDVVMTAGSAAQALDAGTPLAFRHGLSAAWREATGGRIMGSRRGRGYGEWLFNGNRWHAAGESARSGSVVRLHLAPVRMEGDWRSHLTAPGEPQWERLLEHSETFEEAARSVKKDKG